MKMVLSQRQREELSSVLFRPSRARATRMRHGNATSNEDTVVGIDRHLDLYQVRPMTQNRSSISGASGRHVRGMAGPGSEDEESQFDVGAYS
ncbi:hypothetical protein DBV15_05310 [Temnothorax longispinosus]|uniref:Uncharacterized protein n=1 Tax=Temnothorax longispinosus TaxID=300112 RepID=A0A4S2KY22_9HYME|nr:hypothetical protein DBV15_05310 [Temnothorax longispinosus]